MYNEQVRYLGLYQLVSVFCWPFLKMKYIMSWKRWPFSPKNPAHIPGPLKPRRSTVVFRRYMEGFMGGPASSSVIFENTK